MKRYIRNSNIKNTIKLVVDFCYDCSEDVKASVDIDLSDEEQFELLKHEVDSDFEGFIQLVVKCIYVDSQGLFRPSCHYQRCLF